MPSVPGRDDESTDSDPDPADDPLPNGTEHAVILHKDLIVTADRVREHDPETADALGLNDDGDSETVHYEPGEGLSLDLARLVYDAFNDRIACLDADMERICTPSVAEKNGNLDAGTAISAYRSRERRENAEAASDGGVTTATLADRLDDGDDSEEVYACPGRFCDFVADTPQGVSAHRKHCDAPAPENTAEGT